MKGISLFHPKKEAHVCASELIVLLSGEAARSSYTFETIRDNLKGYSRLLNIADKNDVFTYDIQLLKTTATEKLIFTTSLHGKECHRNIAVRTRESWKGGFAIFVVNEGCIVNHKK